MRTNRRIGVEHAQADGRGRVGGLQLGELAPGPRLALTALALGLLGAGEGGLQLDGPGRGLALRRRGAGLGAEHPLADHADAGAGREEEGEAHEPAGQSDGEPAAARVEREAAEDRRERRRREPRPEPAEPRRDGDREDEEDARGALPQQIVERDPGRERQQRPRHGGDVGVDRAATGGRVAVAVGCDHELRFLGSTSR
ncbi:MAG: hypothetical protein QM820_31795 [Minicystis sp.]